VVVHVEIADPHPVLIEPSKRLLKHQGRGISARHRRLDDEEAVVVHVDRGVGAGLIGVVGELDEQPGHQVREIREHARDLDVSLQVFRRGEHDGASHVGFPVADAVIMDREIQRGQRPGSFGEHAFDRVVIDHGDRIAAGPLRPAVDTGREDGAELRRPRRLRDSRFTREVDGEVIVGAGILAPLLGEGRSRHDYDQGRGHEQHQAHH
jgi:hypothetical protein